MRLARIFFLRIKTNRSSFFEIMLPIRLAALGLELPGSVLPWVSGRGRSWEILWADLIILFLSKDSKSDTSVLVLESK